LIKQEHRVQWKRPKIDLDKLAKLYWENGLKIEEIARLLEVGKTTVQENLQKIRGTRDSKSKMIR
jgi:hypothetical protein